MKTAILTAVLSLSLTSPVAAGDYDRSDWPHWLDYDGDCMNTRHELLRDRSLFPVVLSEDGCYVVTGLWYGPYTGKHYMQPRDLDLDHVVPLKWAHLHGGADWDEDRKTLFANDRLNLLLVEKGHNRRKGADGPDQYLPPEAQCDYLQRFRAVVSRYRLAPAPAVADLLNQPCKGD